MNVADVAFTCVLALAAILASLLVSRARTDARRYVQFAAALYGALALASLAAMVKNGGAAEALATSVALIVVSLAPVALALALAAAFEGPPPQTAAIAALLPGCAAGILSAMTGTRFISMAALFASVCAILVFAVRRWRNARSSALQAAIAGLALLAGAAAFMTGGLEAQTSLVLFSAAALLGASLAAAKTSDLAVEQPAVTDPAVTDNVITLIRRDR